jgi:hypothetical protein
MLVPLVLVAARVEAAPAPPAWSQTAEGIHARLIVDATTDAQKRPQVAIALEIENASDVDGGIPLAWGAVGDMLKLELVDDHGKPVTGAGVGGSFASGPPYVVNLPNDSALRVEISKSAIEYVPGGKTLLRPLTFQAWDLPAKHGKLFLRARLSPHALEGGAKPGPRAWTTSLDLPAVALP